MRPAFSIIVDKSNLTSIETKEPIFKFRDISYSNLIIQVKEATVSKLSGNFAEVEIDGNFLLNKSVLSEVKGTVLSLKSQSNNELTKAEVVDTVVTQSFSGNSPLLIAKG